VWFHRIRLFVRLIFSFSSPALTPIPTPSVLLFASLKKAGVHIDRLTVANSSFKVKKFGVSKLPFLCIPIHNRDKGLGVIGFDNFDEVPTAPFDQRPEEGLKSFLLKVGSMLGVTVDLNRKKTSLKLIERVGRNLNATLSDCIEVIFTAVKGNLNYATGMAFAEVRYETSWPLKERGVHILQSSGSPAQTTVQVLKDFDPMRSSLKPIQKKGDHAVLMVVRLRPESRGGQGKIFLMVVDIYALKNKRERARIVAKKRQQLEDEQLMIEKERQRELVSRQQKSREQKERGQTDADDEKKGSKSPPSSPPASRRGKKRAASPDRRADGKKSAKNEDKERSGSADSKSKGSGAVVMARLGSADGQDKGNTDSKAVTDAAKETKEEGPKLKSGFGDNELLAFDHGYDLSRFKFVVPDIEFLEMLQKLVQGVVQNIEQRKARDQVRLEALAEVKAHCTQWEHREREQLFHDVAEAVQVVVCLFCLFCNACFKPSVGHYFPCPLTSLHSPNRFSR
jgi:hypothetical protein